MEVWRERLGFWVFLLFAACWLHHTLPPLCAQKSIAFVIYTGLDTAGVYFHFGFLVDSNLSLGTTLSLSSASSLPLSPHSLT